jgi:tryptophanase
MSSPSPSPPFERFRVKSVEPIANSTAAQRRAVLEACGCNLFRVPASMVAIDLLTDSGTGSMSAAQWAAMMQGDESYAGSASYFRLVQTLTRHFGYSNVLPTHQGRAAERLLVETVIGAGGASGAGLIVPSNAHFDTTRHMIEDSGAATVDLLCRGGDDPDLDAPFKGDMDVEALTRLLKSRGDDVPFVMLTVTCNSNGGQPVSLSNMHAIREACDRFGKMLILDACRFAENAWFISQREPGQARREVGEIAREIFDLSDGVAMSTRKDGLCNVGGLLLLRDDDLHRRACRACVLTRGFQMTYGSLPGRDLEAIAVGLTEVLNENYLAQRAAMIARLAGTLEEGGVQIVRPAGGHAVFIDAEEFLSQKSEVRGQTSALDTDSPSGHSLACAIYEECGVRCTAIGSALRRNARPIDLVRLAIPRRLHTQAQMDYVAASIIALRRRATQIARRPLPHDLDPLPAANPSLRAPLLQTSAGSPQDLT